MTPPLGMQPGADNPTFSWQYAMSERDGIPRTLIRLEARYEDGSTFTRDIDSVDGTCNEYPNAHADVYEKSTMIICYYAGLGHYYKVVEGDDRFQVMRQIFEEGSPDYQPAQEPFTVVAEF
jgi:hypothetical protein